MPATARWARPWQRRPGGHMTSNAHYVHVCAGCDLLFDTARRDQLTCCGACRVRAHRNGSLKTLRADAERFDIEPGAILEAAAFRRLCPELEPKIMSGAMKIKDTRPKVWEAYSALLMKAAAA